ncbi:peptidoglycan D,D-transpeptidase FtsI family protein [Metabacillus sediminilitoris]|uniref:serine-type D-Ala-D-Ala carboxypeptidase n=1 Tax=Metabacillus sediminilitoris TaxID=2567941 RepID=A0A4S4C6M9_9BACI|nr:penicillin-binding protein 2 [Metabacillus sediminilitoris]QGQ46761.1 penicillin-binding protein [Metabacillus sediminilitoris]THF82910.1 penicillin-binding protein 2 [Metabacillus sediminilitoris]
MTEQGANASEQRKLRKSRYVRINVFFFVVFLLFVALIVRLGVVQIVQGEEFSKEVSRTESDYATLPAPRGKMYDRYNRVVVDNESVPAITYTVDKTTKTADKIDTAKKLSEFISYKTEFLKEELKDRDLKDYWLASNPDEAKVLLKEKELTLKPSETYKLQVERVPEDEIAAMKKDPQELELAYIFKRFSSGYQYEPQVVKSTDLSENEVSAVAEHLEMLPGVDVITDWGRKYPYDTTLKTIFGGITTPEQGIPQDREDYFSARGYARNERVGKSYLEQQYEDYLNPRKAKVEYISDKSGNIVSEKVIDEGQRGYDLKLSFDMELQMKVEEIVEDELRKASGSHFLMDRAFVVMMDPYQGDVLAMVGKMLDPENRRGEMLDFDYGAFATQYEAGSVVKGATVLAGYQDGMPIGQSYYDTTLYFKGTPSKSSYKNLGTMNDLSALKLSSNVYMFHVAMRIADVTYVKNGPLDISNADYQKLRNYFAQFGLGVPTGIDLPSESAGMIGEQDTAGKILDIAIGQFDTYTPLQLAQYTSVIANGGSRVQPRIVTSIHQPVEEAELGPIVVDKEPNVLNKINNTQEEIERVQQGFRQVVTSGTASRYINYDVAGKTGTSQTHYYGPKREYWGRDTNNLNFVGYYPSENPEVAFSVVVPWASNDGDAVNKHIANRIVKAYIDLQKKYVTTTEIDMKEEE